MCPALRSRRCGRRRYGDTATRAVGLPLAASCFRGACAVVHEKSSEPKTMRCVAPAMLLGPMLFWALGGPLRTPTQAVVMRLLDTVFDVPEESPFACRH